MQAISLSKVESILIELYSLGTIATTDLTIVLIFEHIFSNGLSLLFLFLDLFIEQLGAESACSGTTLECGVFDILSIKSFIKGSLIDSPFKFTLILSLSRIFSSSSSILPTIALVARSRP